MALADGYIYHIVARLGLERDVPALEMGELGFATDTYVGFLGDTTAQPPRFPTTKSRGEFDFTTNAKFTLPGGIVFDAARPGSVNGVNLADFNKTNGFLVRRGDNSFSSVSFRSPDQSLIVQGGSGTQAVVDLRINPDSDIIQRLFQGIGILNIASVNGLQDVLDVIAASVVAARAGAIDTVRGGVNSNYDTLKKLYDFINANVIVVGDPTGVAAQVIAVLRDGVADQRNTLKKLSDIIDALQTQVGNLQNQVTNIGIGSDYYDAYFIAYLRRESNIERVQFNMIDRLNKVEGRYSVAA